MAIVTAEILEHDDHPGGEGIKEARKLPEKLIVDAVEAARDGDIDQGAVESFVYDYDDHDALLEMSQTVGDFAQEHDLTGQEAEVVQPEKTVEDLIGMTKYEQDSRDWWGALDKGLVAMLKSKDLRMTREEYLEEYPGDGASYDKTQADLHRLVEIASKANPWNTRAEHSTFRHAIRLAEAVSKTEALDWADLRRENPDNVTEDMANIMANRRFPATLVALAHEECGQSLAGGSRFSEASNKLKRRLVSASMLSLGLERIDHSPEATMLKDYMANMPINYYDRIGDFLTEDGIDDMSYYVGLICDIGSENALRLNKQLGIVNFSRWSRDMMHSAVDLLDGKMDGQAVSVIVGGVSGDHNGAFSFYRYIGKTERTIPVEVQQGKEAENVLGRLQDHDVKIKRLTIFGHGDSEGVLLSSEDVLPVDRQALSEHPIGQMIKQIQPNSEGKREVIISSCSAARKFRENDESFIEALAGAFPAENLSVTGAPDIMYLEKPDSSAGDNDGKFVFRSATSAERRIKEWFYDNKSVTPLEDFIKDLLYDSPVAQKTLRWLSQHRRDDVIIATNGETEKVKNSIVSLGD